MSNTKAPRVRSLPVERAATIVREFESYSHFVQWASASTADSKKATVGVVINRSPGQLVRWNNLRQVLAPFLRNHPQIRIVGLDLATLDDHANDPNESNLSDPAQGGISWQQFFEHLAAQRQQRLRRLMLTVDTITRDQVEFLLRVLGRQSNHPPEALTIQHGQLEVALGFEPFEVAPTPPLPANARYLSIKFTQAPPYSEQLRLQPKPNQYVLEEWLRALAEEPLTYKEVEFIENNGMDIETLKRFVRHLIANTAVVHCRVATSQPLPDLEELYKELQQQYCASMHRILVTSDVSTGQRRIFLSIFKRHS